MKLVVVLVVLMTALHACSGQTTGTITWHRVTGNDCARTCSLAGKTAPVNGGSSGQAVCSVNGMTGEGQQ